MNLKSDPESVDAKDFVKALLDQIINNNSEIIGKISINNTNINNTTNTITVGGKEYRKTFICYYC